MQISPFLTAIAKDYNSHVEYVGLHDLTYLKDKPLGIAWQKSPQVYVIEIDIERLICPQQVLFVCYHELGHINEWHLGYRRYLGARSYQEEEADNWAFQKMGMVDKQGNIKEECRICHKGCDNLLSCCV